MTDLIDISTTQRSAGSPFDRPPGGQPVDVMVATGTEVHRALADRRPGLVQLVATWVALVSVQLLLSWRGGVLVAEPPGVLASTVTVTASLCVVAALVLLVVAHRRDQAELGVLGMMFLAISVLPLVHGITTPGVWYGPNAASAVAVLVAPLLASGAVAPILFRRTAWSRWLMRRWRAWIGVWLLVITNLSTLLLAEPDLFGDPQPASVLTVGSAVLSLAVFVALSVRHARLAWAGGGRRSMAVATAFAWVGAAQLVWIGKVPYSIGFWVSHLFDAIGVTVGVLATIGVSKHSDGLARLLRPITVEDPIEAFAVGLDPVVRQHLTAIERRDVEQRDHALRTAELALRVGRRLGLPAHELRDLGVAALVHDLGQVWLPDHVVHPTTRLPFDDDELMRSHVVRGERMLAGSRVTAPIAAIVRSHHEHVDGSGYPDALQGGQIPRLARVLAVVDAFDDLVHPAARVTSMSPAAALDELVAHVGRRWDADVVSELVALVADDGRASRHLTDELIAP